MIVNVLGTEYEIIHQSENENKQFDERSGYVDYSSKRIYISKIESLDIEDKQSDINDTIRHELVHAFLFESGLNTNSDWARNEEIVDWIALQIPKMIKAMQQVKSI